jgi:hypothetical protein
MKKVGRRHFLTGAAGATLALPLLTKLNGHRSVRAATDPLAPRRLIVVTYAMGTVNEQFQPNGTGAAFTLPYITAPLAPFQDRCLFVSNVDNAAMHLNRQHAHGHPAKKESVLTGTLMTGAFTGDGSNRVENVISDQDGSDEGGPQNESVEHFVQTRRMDATHVRGSIDLGVAGRTERESNESESSFFFEGRENPLTLQQNPARAFNQIFAGIDTGMGIDPAVLERRQRKKSVLDAVRGSFLELRSGLGPADQRILDEHAARIRHIEVEIERVACAPPMGIPGVAGGTTASFAPFIDMPMASLAPYMNQIMGAAMGCGLAPVGRIEFTEQHNPLFGLPLVDDEVGRWRVADNSTAWHSLVHGDPSPIDGVPTRAPEPGGVFSQALLDGYRFFVQQYADLLAELDAIPEGEPGMSVLDHSLVVLCSDYGNGNGHSSNKMNFILAGNTGPTGRLGYHVDCGPGYDFYTDTDYNTNQLLTSIVNMMCVTNPDGSPIEQYGLEGFTSGVVSTMFV